MKSPHGQSPATPIGVLNYHAKCRSRPPPRRRSDCFQDVRCVLESTREPTDAWREVRPSASINHHFLQAFSLRFAIHALSNHPAIPSVPSPHIRYPTPPAHGQWLADFLNHGSPRAIPCDCWWFAVRHRCVQDRQKCQCLAARRPSRQDLDCRSMRRL